MARVNDFGLLSVALLLARTHFRTGDRRRSPRMARQYHGYSTGFYFRVCMAGFIRDIASPSVGIILIGLRPNAALVDRALIVDVCCRDRRALSKGTLILAGLAAGSGLNDVNPKSKITNPGADTPGSPLRFPFRVNSYRLVKSGTASFPRSLTNLPCTSPTDF